MNSSILLDTIEGKPHTRPPVWFMRQAGRTLPYYQKLRRRYSFQEIMNTPELAASVTLEPLQELGVDGAIIFTDILIIAEALGMKTSFAAGGPRLDFSLAEADDPQQLLSSHKEKFETVTNTIKLVKKEKPGNIPVIGFCGAPFTLLCYMLRGEGSKNDFPEVARYLYDKPVAFDKLMKTITDMTIDYASAQIDAGIHVFQIFDTHAGTLPWHVYKSHCLPYMKQIIQAIRKKNVPVIFFPKGIGRGYTEMDLSSGDYLGIDWQTPISMMRNRKDKHMGLQGNIDPRLLLADRKQIGKRLEEYIEFGSNEKRWIFNLGHGIRPETPLDNIKFVVDWVKSTEWKRS